MKTLRLTLPNNTNVRAKIGPVRIMRGERSMLLLPLELLPIAKEVANNAEPEQIQYASETFSINMTSEIGRRIALEDIRLAIPSLLKLNDEQVLLKVLRDNLVGSEVIVYKTPQKNDPTKFNIRLAPTLATANDDDLLGLIRSMCLSHSNSLVDAVGEYPANSEVAF